VKAEPIAKPAVSKKAGQKSATRAQARPGEEVREEHNASTATKESAPPDSSKKGTDTMDPTLATSDAPLSTLAATTAAPLLQSHDSTTTNESRTTDTRAPTNPLDSLLRSVPDPQQSDPKSETTEPQTSVSSTQTTAQPPRETPQSFDEHSPIIKAPHLDMPRYIHHFDTYSMVKRLKDSGWAEPQALIVMKAMRVILASETDLAKEALVSKSNLENEGYLFKAACAELRTEITARRKSEQEKLRTERTQLQHEVDIISQRLGQDTGVLKEELKGLFDDRKMAVRNEQRDMQSQIQQLNYKITVELQADARSEVEGLRWIMTRRVIFTLGLVVLMVVGSLKAASSAEAARQATPSPPPPKMVEGGTQTEASSGAGREGSSEGYESLG